MESNERKRKVLVRRLLLFYILFCLVFPMLPVVSADDETTFELLPNSDSVDFNDEFNISIYVTPNGSIDTCAINNLTFSSGLLEFQSISQGDLFGGQTMWIPYSDVSNASGYLSGSLWTYSGSTSSAGYYCNITFKAVGTGVADIMLTSIGIAKDGIPYNTSIVSNSTITISGNATVYANSTTNIEETSATLNGYVGMFEGSSASCGFVYDTSTHASMDDYAFNVTSGSYSENSTFSKAITGLTSGEYYYVRAWVHDDLGFTQSGQEYFLTKPDPPEDLVVSNLGNDSVYVTWTRASVGGGTNRKTLIRYDTDDYPDSVTDGYFAYNGTGASTTVGSLPPSEVYFFSAFTYINASGSPFYWHFSDTYDYASSIGTGNYTVRVYNEESCELMNLSELWNNSGNWTEMIHSFSAERLNGVVINSSHPSAENGIFTFTADNIVRVARFNYNNTCYRSVLVDSDSRNITFYISNVTEGVFNGDLTDVTINFVDYSGALSIENHPYGFIYTYHGSNRSYIHSDMLQADLSLRTDLVIGEIYFIGLGCDVFTIDNLRVLTITENEFDIDVMYSSENTTSVSTWFQIINVSYGWDDDVLFIDIYDTSHSGDNGIQNATVYLYYNSNNTLIDSEVQVTPWDFNYTCSGLNNSLSFYALVSIDYYSEDIDTGDSESWHKVIPLVFGIPLSPIYEPDLDNLLNNTLGESPFYYTDEYDVEHIMSWSAAIVCFFCLIPLMTFGKEYAGIGIAGMGVVLMFFNTMIKLITLENIVVAGFFIFFGAIVIMVTKKEG